MSKEVKFNQSGDVFTVQFTRQEVWAILRVLAIAIDVPDEHDPTKREDEAPRRWVGERLLRKIEGIGG